MGLCHPVHSTFSSELTLLYFYFWGFKAFFPVSSPMMAAMLLFLANLQIATADLLCEGTYDMNVHMYIYMYAYVYIYI